jgi:glycine cleavage system H protein
MPIDGEIIEFNEELESSPELVNESPYDQGWMIKVKITGDLSNSDLLSPEEYSELVGN